VTVFGWIIWAIAFLILVRFFIDIFDQRRYVRIASSVVSLLILFSLVVTSFFDISKFHLIWFVPVAFFSGRSITGAVLFKQTENKIDKHFEKLNDESNS